MDFKTEFVTDSHSLYIGSQFLEQLTRENQVEETFDLEARLREWVRFGGLCCLGSMNRQPEVVVDDAA